MTTLVSDAVAVMDRAGKVIDDLIAANETLKRQNAVMLQALKHVMEYFDNPDIDVPEIEDFMADQVFAEVEAAIKLAKGESR